MGGMYDRGLKVPAVPGASRASLEARAIAVVKEYQPGILEDPGPFNVPHFYEFFVPKRYGLVTGTAELPLGVEGVTKSDGQIVIDFGVYEDMLEGVGRARFTPMHEACHGILHIDVLRSLDCQMVAGRSPALYRRQQLEAFRDPEWQASRLAAAILMPHIAVKRVVQRTGKRPRQISTIFQVSYRAAEVRLAQLEQMGWL